MPFDYFVGELLCHVCGSISDADASTNIQTKIRQECLFENLGVEYPLKINEDILKISDYTLIQMPHKGEATRLLVIWECPTCFSPSNWAVVEIQIPPYAYVVFHN